MRLADCVASGQHGLFLKSGVYHDHMSRPWRDQATVCECCDWRWETRASYEDHVLYMMAMGLDRQYEEAAAYDREHGYGEGEPEEDEMTDLRSTPSR